MVEPVTLGLLWAGLCVAWEAGGKEVTKDVATGLFTNEAHAQLRDSIRTRVLRGKGQPENHDIAKSLRRAQLAATEYVVERFAERAAGPNPPHQFLDRVKSGLTTAKGNVDSLRWDDEIEAALFTAFEAAFDEVGQDAPPTDVGLAATNAAWAEVLGWAGVAATPERLDQRFHGLADGATSWFEAFKGCVAEELKTKPRFKDAFFAGKLVEISGVLVDGKAAWMRVEDATFDLRIDIASLSVIVERGFQDMRAGFDDLKQLLLSQGAIAAAENQGMSAAQIVGVIADYAAGGISFDQAEVLLPQAPQQLRDIRTSLLRLTNADPEVTRLRKAAEQAVEAGRLDEAKKLVMQAADRDRRALAEIEQVRMARALSGAESLSEAARIDRVRGRLRDAAALYGEAADLARPFDPEIAWQCSFTQADILDDHGMLFPGPSKQEALSIWRDVCLPHTPEESRPTDWAMTQSRLGIAFRTIGERGSGEAALAALYSAVAAYEATLRVYTEVYMPADWAGSQNNLGNAFATLGSRAGGEAGLAALHKAVAAYEAALRVRTLASMPAEWAQTQNNLGNSLRNLGARTDGEAGRAALHNAVAAFEAALSVRTEADMPDQWAQTQNNLGNALQSLGARTDGEAGLVVLNKAVTAYEAALRVRTEPDMPAHWAVTQNNLGVVFQTLGARAGGTAGLEALHKAVTTFEAALRVCTEANMPAQWAFTNENIALAEAHMGAIALDPTTVRRAIERMGPAMEVYASIQADFYSEKARRNLASMQALLAELERAS